jgi:hypothetical protein
MFSPINLPFIKPVWSEEINVSITVFNLLAIDPDANLKATFKRVICHVREVGSQAA